MQGGTPAQITYGDFKPKGYYTSFKQWPIYPNSSNMYWSSDQILRILVTINEGLMDPFRSHISMKVSVPAEVMPVGGVQFDNSGQSLISQTVISQNGIELERIPQADTLAAYLTDMGFSQYVCESRYTEGLGYSNIATHTPWSTTHATSAQFNFNWTGTDLQTQNASSSLVGPTRVPGWGGRGNNYLSNKVPSKLSSAVQIMGSTTVEPSNSNILWQGPGDSVTIADVKNAYGRFNNIRQEYYTSILSRNYPDTNHSVLQISPHVKNQTWNPSDMMSISNTSGYNQKAPYTISYAATNKVSSYIAGENKTADLPNTCLLYGYEKPIAAQFARGTGQAFLSPTIPQCQMQNGQILPTKVPVYECTLNLPLISAICGILIPVQQFLLIPMKALFNLLLQITLSRYGMFTSGYCDVHEFDKKGMQNQIPRKWLISDVAWNLHLYTFASSQINESINASLVKQIPISVYMYTLASQFQLPNGQTVRNSWPINTQSESVASVVCMFLANDYLNYTFCRKQYRLSNNITSMQLKCNTQYFPSQPIVGNAGNPQTLDSTGCNWPFYQQLLLSNNYLFNTNYPYPKINPKNYSINSRQYDIANQNTYYDQKMYQEPKYTWTEKSVNKDTALGMCQFKQNTYVGKCVYQFSFQPYGHSKNYMNGLNAQGQQSFTITFNNLSAPYFPRDQTLYIFTKINAIVIYGVNGIRVVGK